MDVEFEHGSHDPQTNVTGDDPIVTGKIALAHMKEFPDYYERLERMERRPRRLGRQAGRRLAPRPARPSASSSSSRAPVVRDCVPRNTSRLQNSPRTQRFCENSSVWSA